MRFFLFNQKIYLFLLVVALHFSTISVQAQDLQLAGSTAFCKNETARTLLPKSNTTLKSVAQSTTVFRTDFASAGVGGLRDVGNGQILLTGLSGTVTKAYLYWHGVSSSSANVGQTILVNGLPVNGTNIGVSDNNCWGYANSQAYRADVTSLVLATGNGSYQLNGFGGLNPNGASLIVFFNDGNTANDREVVIFEGNDSNIAFGGIAGNPNAPFDPQGWDVRLSGINYVSGAANIQMHVADGQAFADDGLSINNATLVPAGPIFSGNSVPSANNGPAGNGSLWDIKTFNVTSFLAPGSNTLNLTTGLYGDCLGLIVALIDLPAGAAPPPPNTIATAIIPASVCEGSPFLVSFTATGTYQSGNVFTAQLSNASGSFASPVAIGSLTATGSGTIGVQIPVGTAPGTGYRVRVVSSNPPATGTDNGSNITITSATTWYLDADGDGFAVSTTRQCTSPGPGYTATVLPVNDCDDTRKTYMDNDGDGVGSGAGSPCGAAANTDCNDADASVTAPQVYFIDQDGDGHDFGTAMLCSSTAPAGYSATSNGSDCNDQDASVNSLQTYYADADGDGFGSSNNPIKLCLSQAPAGYVTNNSDCNDNLMMYRDADSDGFGSAMLVACNGVTNSSDCNDQQLQYGDADGDGFGSTTLVACNGVSNKNDCDDNMLMYGDSDGDGFGSQTLVACSGVSNNNDCDDAEVQYQDNDGDGYGSRVKVACHGVANDYDSDDLDGKPLIYICHKGKTLVVNAHAATGHEGHADALGMCSAAVVSRSDLRDNQAGPALTFKLANYPNPFGNSTRIQYSIPEDARVVIRVFDLMGKELGTLNQGARAAGNYSVEYNTTSLGQGVYFCRLEVMVNGRTVVQNQKLVKAF